MSTEGMPDVVALLFGVGIIIAFSYERFNRISYETGRRLERLVKLLTPDKLRARRQVTYAHFLYSLALIVLYLILCAYAEVLLPLIGGGELIPDVGASALPEAAPAAPATTAATVPTGYSPMDKPAVAFWTDGLTTAATVVQTAPSNSLGIAPEVSMGLALIMVGLAPSIPALTRADEWLRTVAHRMAGIPTWAIDAADALRSNAKALNIFPDAPDSDDGEPHAGFLISRSEYDRMRDCRKKAGDHLGNIEDFMLNLELIMVSSAWFLEEKLYLPGNGEKERFKEIEEDLRERRNRLFQRADSKLTREEWEALAADADALASDFCILIALYDEHGVIQPHGQRPSATPAQREARERLKTFVEVLYDNKTEPMMRRRGTNIALFWTLGIVMAWTLFWAVSWFGAAEFGLQRGRVDTSPYLRMLLYGATAFNSYGLAAIVAITLRWVRTMAEPEEGQRKWENMRYPSHWTRWVPQAGLVLLVTTMVSTAIILAIQIWQSGLLGERGWSLEFWTSIRRMFEYNAPIAVRGAVLAIVLLVLLDARQKLWMSSGRYEQLALKVRQKLEPDVAKDIHLKMAVLRPYHEAWRALSLRDSLRWAGLGAGVMLITAGVTRYFSYRAGAKSAGEIREFRSFDAIDMGLMIWAVLFCTILGAAVMFCVSEALTGRAIDKSHLDEADEDTLDETTNGEATA